MDRLPQSKIGDTVNFKFGEVIYKAVVYNGKIVGFKREDQITNDTSKNDILKDLMSIAAETVEGKDVQITIKSDQQGPYRIIRTVTTKMRTARQ